MCNHNRKYETEELFFDFTLNDDNNLSRRIKKNINLEDNHVNDVNLVNEDLNKISGKNNKNINFNDQKVIDVANKKEDEPSYVEAYYNELKTINKLSRSRRKHQKKEDFLSDSFLDLDNKNNIDNSLKNNSFKDDNIMNIKQKENYTNFNKKNELVSNESNGLSKVQKALLYAQNDLNNKNKDTNKELLSNNKVAVDVDIENIKKEINNPLNRDFDLKSLLEKITSTKEIFLNDINDNNSYDKKDQSVFLNNDDQKKNTLDAKSEDSSFNVGRPIKNKLSRRTKNKLITQQEDKNINNNNEYNDTKEHIISLEEDLAKTLEIPVSSEKDYKLDLPKIENNFSYNIKKYEDNNRYNNKINDIKSNITKKENIKDIKVKENKNDNLVINKEKTNTRSSRRKTKKNNKNKRGSSRLSFLFQTPVIIFLLIVIVLSVFFLSFNYIMNNKKNSYNYYDYNIESSNNY